MDTEVILTRANRAIKFRRKKAKSSGGIAGPPAGEVSLASLRGRSGPLADELKLFFGRVARPAMRNVSVPEAFEQIAGDYLAQNCRIESLTAGVMKVKVKSGPYMFELRCRAGRIVEELKQQCPSSNIREIRLSCAE